MPCCSLEEHRHSFQLTESSPLHRSLDPCPGLFFPTSHPLPTINGQITRTPHSPLTTPQPAARMLRSSVGESGR